MKPDADTSSFGIKIEEILQSISQPNFDLDFYCGLILKEKPIRDEVVRQMITNPFIMIYYHCFYVVEKATQQEPALFYNYWPEFAVLLNHANSYHRDFGLILIANLVGVDTEGWLMEILPEYLSHAQDRKFMTACCCLQNCKKIILTKPELKEKVFDVLVNYEKSSPYSDSQKAYLKFHLLEFIQQGWENTTPGIIHIEYIHDSNNCASPKTRKKAKELIKSFNI